MNVVAAIPWKGLFKTASIVGGLFFGYQLQRGASSLTAITAGLGLGALGALIAGVFWVALSTQQNYVNRLSLSGLVLWLAGIGAVIWLLSLPVFGDAGGVTTSFLLIGAVTLFVKWIKRDRLA
jgi:hypothetical protein